MNCSARLKSKKFFFLYSMICVSILLSSCSSDIYEVSDKAVEDFTVKVAENFSHNPLKNLRNIQVGDTLRYDVEIVSPIKNGSCVYSFNPNSSDEPGHRRLGKDYRMFIYNNDSLKQIREVKDSGAIITEKWINSKEIRDSVSLSGKGKYTLLIIPLRAGSFTENFTFTEYVSKKYFKVQQCHLNFNCVKLTAWAVDVQTLHKTVLRKSLHRNDFYIRVEDGLEENDRYLNKQKNREQSCLIFYDGQTYNEKFEEGEDICFLRSGETKKHRPEIKTRFIKQIVIVQKDADSPELRIEFNNIPLIIN